MKSICATLVVLLILEGIPVSHSSSMRWKVCFSTFLYCNALRLPSWTIENAKKVFDITCVREFHMCRKGKGEWAY
ncbi:hypothetical protein ScPMuIL_008610 [Solemya velum]